MAYFYNTEDDIREMLAAIGAGSIEELFRGIPANATLNRPLSVGPALTEIELTRRLAEMAARNSHAGEKVCFLGGGAYDHFVPAVVDAIAGRGEFYTSYTPYQPEVSQGNLQAMFEYQTLITRLTGMDVSNASLYDGGSAAAEAVLMAISCTKRFGRVVLPESLHPEYRQAIATYLTNFETEIVTVPTPGGVLTCAELARVTNDQTACVVVQQPNFFGAVEELAELAKIAHAHGALVVTAFDPIGLGLLAHPGDQGADICIAEGQSLGTSMQFGGPYLGIMACRNDFVRRLPGRIAGATVDRQGRRCFVLTLQTREQHIRREKATSNICTNQGLFALRAAVYLAQMGPQGLRETANLCLQKSRYALEQIVAGGRYEPAFPAATFKEFVLRDRRNRVDAALAHACERGFLAGIPLSRWYPNLADCFLVAVTEKRTKEQIDALATCLNEAP